jgi:cold-inducible RNA-binding protein
MPVDNTLPLQRQAQEITVMKNRLYVGNLSNDISEAQLQEFFGTYGTVVSVKIKLDSVTGESWGYGFVEMGDPAAAEAAMQGANGQKLGQNKLKIDAMQS